MGGRGRGVAAFSFNVEALGISRGSMPEARVGPNPLFPNTESKPVPLRDDEGEVYMLALKQEMRGTMQRLPHNIKPHSARAAVERYKDRYNKINQLDNEEWIPDWNLFPKELQPRVKGPQVKPAGVKKKPVKPSVKEAKDMLSKLDELEKKGDGVEEEKSDDEKPKAKKPAEGEEEELEEEVEEEELEEENDYIDNYFDNGEDFGAVSDDNMDAEATY